MAPMKAALIGSGNWGTCVGKIVAENTAEQDAFDTEVLMWVFEETVDGRKLSEIINNEHENTKYLPGVKLPVNLKAETDLEKVVRSADLLVFILPHQFLVSILKKLKPFLKSKDVKAISLAKGLYVTTSHVAVEEETPCHSQRHSHNDGEVSKESPPSTHEPASKKHKHELLPWTCSKIISKILEIPCDCLGGANVSRGCAIEEFSETTVGYRDIENAQIWTKLFTRPYFYVDCIPDIDGVQVCGAMKNVIALACGFCDGMGLGTNTKAAIIRMGMQEMKLFAVLFFDGILEETFMESCGVADTVTTCFAGRNVKGAAEFIRRGPEAQWEEVERDLLGGMKLQGHLACKEVYEILSYHQLTQHFPLFVASYRIAFERKEPQSLILAMAEETREPKLLSTCAAPTARIPKKYGDLIKQFRDRPRN